MNSNKNVWIALVVIGIIAIGGYFYPSLRKSIGLGAANDCGTNTCLTSLYDTGTLAVDGATTLASTLAVTGATTLSSLTVTTTNAATSTIAVGCIQTVATSTATKIRLFIGSPNSAASSTASSLMGTGGGFVTWGYGACPN